MRRFFLDISIYSAYSYGPVYTLITKSFCAIRCDKKEAVLFNEITPFIIIFDRSTFKEAPIFFLKKIRVARTLSEHIQLFCISVFSMHVIK